MGPYVVIEGAPHEVVRYSVLHENEQVFASKYKLVLPSEEGGLNRSVQHHLI
jgi:hypothetical protein